MDSLTKKFNIFSVVGIERNENRISNILGWLLDPNENHELGDLFLKEFINIYFFKQGISNPYKEKSLSKAYIIREYSLNASNRIDILILNDELKFVFFIENKIDSSQGYHNGISQTELYYNLAENLRQYESYAREYVFLALSEELIYEKYVYITYSDILLILSSILPMISSQGKQDAPKYLIEDFKENIEVDLLNEYTEFDDLLLEGYFKYPKIMRIIEKNDLRQKIWGRLDKLLVFDSEYETVNLGNCLQIHKKEWKKNHSKNESECKYHYEFVNFPEITIEFHSEEGDPEIHQKLQSLFNSEDKRMLCKYHTISYQKDLEPTLLAFVQVMKDFIRSTSKEIDEILML